LAVDVLQLQFSHRPSWKTDMEKFLRQCVPCARYHRGVTSRQAGLQPTLVGEPWERVSVDLIPDLHAKISTYLLVCVIFPSGPLS